MFHSVAQAALKFSLRVICVLDPGHADICKLTGSFPGIYGGPFYNVFPIPLFWHEGTPGRESSRCGFETTNKTVKAFTKGEGCAVWQALSHPLWQCVSCDLLCPDCRSILDLWLIKPRHLLPSHDQRVEILSVVTGFLWSSGPRPLAGSSHSARTKKLSGAFYTGTAVTHMVP